MNSGESRQFTHNSSLSTVHSLAFTLAETLIVMGIIGVVAALTIPNVNKNTSEAEKVAKFKKLYAELNEALDRATAVYGPFQKWRIPCNNIYGSSEENFDECVIKRITEFMKVTKYCDNAHIYECMPEKVTSLGDTHEYDPSFQTYAVILANGASFCVEMNDSALYLDIDGPKKGKNSFGIDIFRFSTPDETVFLRPLTYITPEEFRHDHITNCTISGEGCGQWILDNGNMDYLMVKDRSTHELSRTCPNGKKLGYDTAAGDVSSCK